MSRSQHLRWAPLLLWGGLVLSIMLCPLSWAQDQNQASDPKIRALGRIEPTAGLINLSTTAGEQRIQELLVDEGQTVSKDQVLVRLVGYDAQTADIAWLEAQVRTAGERIEAEPALRKARLASARIRDEQQLITDLEQINILEYEIVSLTAGFLIRTIMAQGFYLVLPYASGNSTTISESGPTGNRCSMILTWIYCRDRS